eukprot:s1673_g11.t2
MAGSHGKLPDFGTSRFTEKEPEKPPKNNLQPILLGRQLKAVAAADRILSQRVFEEAGALQTKVSRAKEDLRAAKQQVDEAQEVQLHLLELQQQLERQIREHRENLAVAAEERRRLIDLTCGFPSRDAMAAKRKSLEEALHDEMRCLEEAQDSNALLEDSVGALLQEMEKLQQERLSILQQVLNESNSPEVYGLLKVPELKRELQRRQLNAVGTRRELTERLLEDDRRSQETLDTPGAGDAVDAVDCEIVEESVDFDLYGGVKGELMDDPEPMQPIDSQGDQQVPTVPTADDATLGQPEKTQEEGRVKRRKRKRRQSKGLQHKEAPPTEAPAVPSAPVPSETQAASEAAAAEAAEVPASQETSEEKAVKFLKDVLKRCSLDERLGCHGYEDLLLQLHEKLLPPYQHPLDAAFEPPQDVVPAPEDALEAAWASKGEEPQDAAESEGDQDAPDQGDHQAEKTETSGLEKPEGTEGTEEAQQLSPALQEELGRLEAKVQEAMRRTARAQLQLRRKKAEELPPFQWQWGKEMDVDFPDFGRVSEGPLGGLVAQSCCITRPSKKRCESLRNP